MKKALSIFFFLLAAATSFNAHGQTVTDDDIWREVGLSEVDFQKSKNYCLRIYGYYRFEDDGVSYFKDRELKLYRVDEGIVELDVRYSKDEDDGAKVIKARNLVHPEKKGSYMDFYELKPYTFLEKARRVPKVFTIKNSGDTTHVYSKNGQEGYAVRDAKRKELRMSYNALAPDTSLTLNILLVKGHVNRAHAEATYRSEDEDVLYVPQGDLKHIVFEGDLDISLFGKTVRDVYHELTEFYVDSVVYLTKDEYKAANRTPLKERAKRYVDMDIDQLKKKLGVPPLSAEVQNRIEAQRDWEEQLEQWMETEKKKVETKNK